MNNLNLNGKVAYITGGSRGIGYGIAKALLDEGMKVAITSRTFTAAKQAAGSLTKDTSKVLALESNVSSLDSETKAVQATIDHFGQLDVLIANAGVGHFAPIESLTEQEWKETRPTSACGTPGDGDGRNRPAPGAHGVPH